jgi:penicillin amidase
MVWWLLVILLIACLGLTAWWWLFRMALPQTNGTLKGPGLGALATIVRDRWGVPHITTESMADGLYALGFAHAQDRLWQMELQRRIGSGRLAEIFGPVALDADRLLRRLGLRRAAEAEAAALEPEEHALLDAYCRGVNAAMAQGRLPLEFRLLGIKAAPWAPVDSLTWVKMMSFSLVHNWTDELFRYQLAQKLGPEVAARVEATYPAGLPLTNEPDGPGAADSAAELLRLFEAAKPFLASPGGASNSWVVAGRRTESGKPLLANDPHLGLQVPSTWYEAHITCPKSEVTGATLPGVPGVVIGHNRHTAWGMTDAFADTADLFVERWHPQEASYEYQGAWEPATVIAERIAVKGKPDEIEQVFITRHGPIVAGGPLGDGPPLSLRWTIQDAGHPIKAVKLLNEARSLADALGALKHWTSPCLNFSLADGADNIGYVLAGRLPVRRQGTGLTPVPGWTGEYEWEGWVPFAGNPQVINPACGYVVHANNKVVDEDYPHHISWDYMPGYRAQRLVDLIRSKPKLSAQESQAMQMDLYCLPGVEFVGHCKGLKPTAPLEQQALQALLKWDGHLRADSVGGAIYVLMQHHAVRRLYGPLLGEELLNGWLGKGILLAPASARTGRSTTALLRELRTRDPKFAPQSSMADPWEGLLAASLTDTVDYLTRTLGGAPERWQWGRLHRLKLSHPMGASKLLQFLFPGREVPIGGDMSTAAQTAYAPHQSFMATAWAPSYRQVVDFGDLGRSVSIHPGGQSGHPRSSHYMDLFPLWLQGEYHPMLFTPAAVREKAMGVLRLEP